MLDVNWVSHVSRAALATALLLGGASVAGCTGTATVQGGALYGYSVYEPDYVPSRIYYYPRTHYRGDYAYLVDGRWYYPSRGRWVVFRSEPTELRRYRVTYQNRYEPRYRTPPPRRPTRSPEYAAPPAPRRYYPAR